MAYASIPRNDSQIYDNSSNYFQKTSPFNFIKLFNKNVSKKIIEDIHSENKINFNCELLASQKEKILKLKKNIRKNNISR